MAGSCAGGGGVPWAPRERWGASRQITALHPPGRQGALCTGRSRCNLHLHPPCRRRGALWGGKMAALSAGRTAVTVRGCGGRCGARRGGAGPGLDAGCGVGREERGALGSLRRRLTAALPAGPPARPARLLPASGRLRRAAADPAGQGECAAGSAARNAVVHRLTASATSAFVSHCNNWGVVSVEQ